MENTTNQERQTAYIVSISSIHRAIYTKTEGEWEPNYVLIKNTKDGVNKKVSRANLMGVVISGTTKEGPYNAFTIDDSTGTISIRIFEEETKHNYELGDIVIIIGKIREFNSEKYIVPEIIKKIENDVWLDVRKKELEQIGSSMLTRITPDEQIKQPDVKTESSKNIKAQTNKNQQKQSENKTKTIEDEFVENADILAENDNSTQTNNTNSTENNTEKVFNLIKELDKNDGANIEDVISQSGLSNCEDIIETLLNEGEIFEVKPGHLKVLE